VNSKDILVNANSTPYPLSPSLRPRARTPVRLAPLPLARCACSRGLIAAPFRDFLFEFAASLRATVSDSRLAFAVWPESSMILNQPLPSTNGVTFELTG
jgi:hypothetical protein